MDSSLTAFLIASTIRGIEGVLLPFEVAKEICRHAKAVLPRLRCCVCDSVVLADREHLWATKREKKEWFVSSGGYLVDSHKRTWRSPISPPSPPSNCFRLPSSPFEIPSTCEYVMANGRLYSNRTNCMVLVKKYFVDYDAVRCESCHFARRRLRSIWLRWRVNVWR